MAFCWTRGDKEVGTTYSQYEDDFFWDDVLERLVKKDIPKDTQAIVDSCFNTRLEAILDYYSDVLYNRPHVVIDEGIVEADGWKSDLDRILEADEAIERFKASDDRYSGMSREQLVFQMRQKYTELVKKIKEQKGVPENEKVQASEKAEQEAVHKDGDESKS